MTWWLTWGRSAQSCEYQRSPTSKSGDSTGGPLGSGGMCFQWHRDLFVLVLIPSNATVYRRCLLVHGEDIACGIFPPVLASSALNRLAHFVRRCLGTIQVRVGLFVAPAHFGAYFKICNVKTSLRASESKHSCLMQFGRVTPASQAVCPLSDKQIVACKPSTASSASQAMRLLRATQCVSCKPGSVSASAQATCLLQATPFHGALL